MISCQRNVENNPKINPNDFKRIVLIGGSLISSMEDHSFFEASLFSSFPKEEISLRNIGWPADDVYGLARSQFGSAQNTRSWQPPSAEEGFGSKVLSQHIKDATPTTLIIGYGSEVAYAKEEKDFTLFTSGYERLLDLADSLGTKLVLLSPPKQENSLATNSDLEKRNEWLGKVSAYIEEQAKKRGVIYIDLYNELIVDPSQNNFTENGVQLNRAGYERMNEILLKSLGIQQLETFSLRLDKTAKIAETQNCQTSEWASTVYGASFNLKPNTSQYEGKIISQQPVAVYIDGELYAKNQDTITHISLTLDSLQQHRLVETIKEKNRLHRYRLRPLNEAYIYLFRRHEMGHLAYEMDDLERLVEEKEREIKQLLTSYEHHIEIELIRPWKSPKDYPEDEVPAFIPEPNIEKELAAFNISDGFEISLFASDPMIANPININWDTKGRAWVATSSTYPHIVPGREPNDKIVILEDTDNDGKADKHTVFAENLLIPQSVMPVKGGAYVTASTQVLFFADTDGDDVADERRVVFDGFGNADVHHMIHGLRWAPWGDLYFTQSIYINSFIETAYGPRVLNGSGTWAFRPETERLEIFTRGLINPWGKAFDKWGQAFATDGAGSSGINYIFPASAHATAVGADKVLPGLNSGTPKNTAAEVIYSRHFPASWQGTIVTNDFRANRTVRYQIVPSESGYKSEEVETIIRSDHRSYRPVDNKIGPDGALYIVDWYNPIIDHGEVDFHHPIRDKTHGRVWKLTRKGRPLLKPANIHGSSIQELLNFLKSPEQFTRIQANRALVERSVDPQLVINWAKGLSRSSANFEQHRLEGLWLLRALNHYDEALLQSVLESSNPRARAAAVRMLAHWQKQGEHENELIELINDSHPQVRLEALHALREMGHLKAAEIAINALDHPTDENLDFALWLTISSMKDAWIPELKNAKALFDGDVNKQMYALLTTNDPGLISHIEDLLENAQLDDAFASEGWTQMAKFGNAAAKGKVLEKAVKEENWALLRAMVNAPDKYNEAPENIGMLESILSHELESVRMAGLRLAGKWQAKQYASSIANQAQKAEGQNEKLTAFRALVALGKENEVINIAKSQSDVPTQTAACAVWIENDVEGAANYAVNFLSNLNSPEMAELIFRTFGRLVEGPEVLRKSLEGKSLPENIASVGLKIVQTMGLNLFALEKTIREAGNIQAVGLQMTQAEKAQLIQDAAQSGSTSRGRAIYRRKELLCATCHRIDGIGGQSGPNLTTVGSYMTPNSILESILNPSTDIKQGYETVTITKKNGEIMNGLLHRKTNTATLLRLANSEIISVPAEEIEKVDVSPVSLMPMGLTSNLHRDELKDLLAYLTNLGAAN